jgi:hypothetical protein
MKKSGEKYSLHTLENCHLPRATAVFEKLTMVHLAYQTESPSFMKKGCSLPCSQQPTTGLCPESDEFTIHWHSFCTISFNIILTFTLRFSKWSLSFRFSNKYLYELLVPSVRAIRCTHPIPHVISLKVFAEEYKPWRSLGDRSVARRVTCCP